MKFTLKDYQEDAIKDVFTNLRKASKRWHEDGDRHSFSLTATTGAGKTVMAAAVFETLFHGDDNFDFEPDPGAVVIWFSGDPALNAQSHFRLREASNRLTLSDLVIDSIRSVAALRFPISVASGRSGLFKPDGPMTGTSFFNFKGLKL